MKYREIMYTNVEDYAVLENMHNKGMFGVSMAMNLSTTDEPISQVAVKVGYPDQMAFSKSFKKKYGISPQQYRKEQKKALVLDEKLTDTTRAVYRRYSDLGRKTLILRNILMFPAP